MSTALERMFIERGDHDVFHESFAYVYFMHEKRAEIPHKNEDSSHPMTYADVRDTMERARAERPVFHKDFPYHVLHHLRRDPEYLLGQVNTFLIRDPDEAVLSHATINPGLTREVLGYQQLAELFDLIRDLTGTVPHVINAADLSADPEPTIRRYCTAAGIDFLPGALAWTAGDQPEWATWKGWHEDVAGSSGFRRPTGRYAVSFEQHPHLRDFADWCRPCYDHIDQYRVHPGKELV
jgi:hypothetical protein